MSKILNSWNFKFIDGNNKIVKVEVNKRDWNGYEEFGFSGEVNGSSGQVYDDFSAVGVDQELLLKLWNLFHIAKAEDVIEGSDYDDIDELEGVLDELVSSFEDEWGEHTFDKLTYEEAKSILEDAGISETEVAYMLASIENLPIGSVDDIEEESNCRWSIAGVEYLAGTDSEMDDFWDDALDCYLEECIYPDLPKGMEYYFDDEKWKRDARQDGRGHSLNRYDGGEEDMNINGVWYYAYRQ